MIPSLSPLSGASTGSVQVPPPPGFKPIHYPIIGVVECDPRTLPDGNTAAQKSGLRYERKAHEHFKSLFPANYLESPVLSFTDDAGGRYCIPDGVLCFSKPKRIFVLEFKFQHMPEAWWQLRELYQPVIEKWRPEWQLSVIEVCRSFDPAVPFPEPPVLIHSISEWVKDFHPEFGVYRWR